MNRYSNLFFMVNKIYKEKEYIFEGEKKNMLFISIVYDYQGLFSRNKKGKNKNKK